MKTNVIMESEKSRNLFGVVIRQNTDKSMLSLTDLQEAYTQARVLNGWSEKNITMILNAETNIERFFYILKEQKMLDVTESEFYSDVNSVGIIKYLKNMGLYKTTGKGANKMVWSHVSIWLLIALEYHPIFYTKVLDFVSDDKNFKSYHCGYEDFKSEERVNHKKAWKYFYPEGNGKPKENYVLHHKDPKWRYEDFERYAKWNVEDLVMMTNKEHLKLHKELGYEYVDIDRDFQLISACDLNRSLRIALGKYIVNPDYAEINRNLNIKIFGHHETGMRNLASESELKKLNTLQENIAFCVERGFLKTNEEIIKEIKGDKK